MWPKYEKKLYLTKTDRKILFPNNSIIFKMINNTRKYCIWYDKINKDYYYSYEAHRNSDRKIKECDDSNEAFEYTQKLNQNKRVKNEK